MAAETSEGRPLLGSTPGGNVQPSVSNRLVPEMPRASACRAIIAGQDSPSTGRARMEACCSDAGDPGDDCNSARSDVGRTTKVAEPPDVPIDSEDDVLSDSLFPEPFRVQLKYILYFTTCRRAFVLLFSLLKVIHKLYLNDLRLCLQRC